jgi:hypothetical protein
MNCNKFLLINTLWLKVFNTLSLSVSFQRFSAISFSRAVKRSACFDLKWNAKLPEGPFSCDIVFERFYVRYSYFDVKILKFPLFDFACNNINHGSPNFLWQRATLAIAGWLAGKTGQIAVSGVPNRQNYRLIFTVHTYFTNWLRAE